MFVGAGCFVFVLALMVLGLCLLPGCFVACYRLSGLVCFACNDIVGGFCCDCLLCLVIVMVFI